MSPVNSESILIYTLGFFIYINIKVALFLAFYKYVKKLINKKKRAKTETKELSTEELHKWYEASVFKKISKIDYDEDMVKLMYRISKTGQDMPPPNKKHHTQEKFQIGDLTIITGVIPRYTIKKSVETENDKKIESK